MSSSTGNPMFKTSGSNHVKTAPSILSSIDFIVKHAKDSMLSAEFFRLAKKHVSFISESFEITPRQAVIFSLCVDHSSHRFDRDDITSMLGISNVQSIMLFEDFELLSRRRLIRYRDIHEMDSMYVPNAVVAALKHNQPYLAPNNKDLDIFAFFEYLGMLFNDFECSSISLDGLVEELNLLFENNKSLSFVSKLNSYKLDEYSWLLFLYFCHKQINDDDDEISFTDIEGLFDHRRMFSYNKVLFTEDRHELIMKELVEHHNDNGMYNQDYFCLTPKAKTNLLPQFKIHKIVDTATDLLHIEAIAEKQLFFSDEVNRQVEEMAGFLDCDRYNEIKKRMQKHGFRSGFACLFYGNPGTGKTESVYQLARRSGRCVMLVDVPQIKSKWVGDSEKNIKGLFDRYRALVGRSELAPILLFNEADAILGARMQSVHSAVDKMENAIQNIILQEMENLDGIMIATTNLVENFDTAFERRFLYKIRFEKPDAAIRACIWKQMVNDLTENEICSLSGSYDFSGGQIENVARKYVIGCILHGEPSDRLGILRTYCEAELLEASKSRRIGF